MQYLKNVLIKEVDGTRTGDKVFYIDNLPITLLMKLEPKRIIDYTDPQQRIVNDFVLTDEGRKKFTGEKEWVLLPGIEKSQSGDEGYCFHTAYNEAKQRLLDIDNYIRANMPVLERIPSRIPYALQPGLLSSSARPLHTLPRVVLPEPVSPPAKAVQAEASTVVLPKATKVRKPRKPMTEEQKKAAADRMAKARAAKKASV